MTTPVKQRRRMRRLIALQILTLILGLGSLTYANSIQGSDHYAARYDNCELLRGLVFAATKYNHAARASAVRYIDSTQLADCHRYASGGAFRKAVR